MKLVDVKPTSPPSMTILVNGQRLAMPIAYVDKDSYHRVWFHQKAGPSYDAYILPDIIPTEYILSEMSQGEMPAAIVIVLKCQTSITEQNIELYKLVTSP